MAGARRETPTWLLKSVLIACISWCAVGVVSMFLSPFDTRRAVVLATFTHDPTAGTLPWRVTLEGPDGGDYFEMQGMLVWKRRSDPGFPMPIFQKRFEFVLSGEPPAGAPPLSREDAESLLQGAYASLPSDADRALIAARNEFLLAIAPRSAFDELVVGYLIFDLTVVIAAVGAFVSYRALRKRRAAQAA